MYKLFADYTNDTSDTLPWASYLIEFLREKDIEFELRNKPTDIIYVDYIKANLNDEDAILLKINFPKIHLEYIKENV